MKLWILLILLAGFIFVLCDNASECKTNEKKEVQLVAYRVSKHSRFWLKETGTNKIHEITGMGSRRIPRAQLGSILTVWMCNDRVINEQTLVYVPVDRTRRFVCLPGYEYLEP